MPPTPATYLAGTTEQWAIPGATPAFGQLCHDTTANELRVGDGHRPYPLLPVVLGGDGAPGPPGPNSVTGLTLTTFDDGVLYVKNGKLMTLSLGVGLYISPNGRLNAANQPPVANYSVAPGEGSTTAVFAYTDTSAGGPTSWLWAFGDGATSTLQNPTHQYAANGTYVVSLTATNGAGSDVNNFSSVFVRADV